MNSIDSPEKLVVLVREEADRLHQYLAALPVEAWQHETACDKWDVSEVVAHLARGAQLYTDWIGRGIRGDSSTPTGSWEAGTVNGVQAADSVAEKALAFRESLGDAVLAIFRDRNDRLLKLFGSLGPQDWENPCYHPGAIFPVRTFLSLRVMELSLHGWDIRSRLEKQAPIAEDGLRVVLKLIPDFLGWLFQPGERLSAPVRYRFHLSGEPPGKSDVVVEGDKARMESAESSKANIDIHCAAQAFVLLIFGRLSFSAAISSGQMEVSGDRALTDQFSQWFAGA